MEAAEKLLDMLHLRWPKGSWDLRQNLQEKFMSTEKITREWKYTWQKKKPYYHADLIHWTKRNKWKKQQQTGHQYIRLEILDNMIF